MTGKNDRRWPEETSFKVREVKFWRAANGRPTRPVHTLIDEVLVNRNAHE